MRALSLGSPSSIKSFFDAWVTASFKDVENASHDPTPATLVSNDSLAPLLGATLDAVLNALGTVLSIADDGFATIDLSSYDNKAALIQLASNAVTGPSGSFFARTDATNNARTVAFAAGPTITFTTGALNGTTGVDGQITISAANTGLVYIENRSGAALIIVARILGA